MMGTKNIAMTIAITTAVTNLASGTFVSCFEMPRSPPLILDFVKVP